MSREKTITAVVLLVALVALWDAQSQILRDEFPEAYLGGFNVGRPALPPWEVTANRQGRLEYDAVPGNLVVVIANQGSVNVRGGDGEGLTGAYSLTVTAHDEVQGGDRAQNYLDGLSVKVYPRPSGELVVELAEPLVRPSDIISVRAVLDLSVPARVSVVVISAGSVTVEDVAGDVVTSGVGSAVVRRIGGNVRVSTERGPIEVSSVGGSVEVEQERKPQDYKDDYELVVADVAGDVTLECTRVNCSVARVGSVAAVCRLSDLRLESIGGPITVDAEAGHVSVQGLACPLSGTGRKTFYHLDLAPDAGFSVDIRSQAGGAVHSDYPLETSRDDATGKVWTRGAIGDGAYQLKLDIVEGWAVIRAPGP